MVRGRSVTSPTSWRPDCHREPAGHGVTPSVAAAVEQIASDCQTADGVNPLDEAAQLRLRHHGMSGSRLWLHEHGFALLHEGEAVIAVSYWKRGEGIGSLLAAAAVEGGARSAWSHAGHIAARKIAARLGFERSRRLRVTGWTLNEPKGDVE